MKEVTVQIDDVELINYYYWAIIDVIQICINILKKDLI